MSGERFRRELEKTFADAARGLDPSRCLRHLADWHVLAGEVLSGEVDAARLPRLAPEIEPVDGPHAHRRRAG